MRVLKMARFTASSNVPCSVSVRSLGVHKNGLRVAASGIELTADEPQPDCFVQANATDHVLDDTFERERREVWELHGCSGGGDSEVQADI